MRSVMFVFTMLVSTTSAFAEFYCTAPGRVQITAENASRYNRYDCTEYVYYDSVNKDRAVEKVTEKVKAYEPKCIGGSFGVYPTDIKAQLQDPKLSVECTSPAGMDVCPDCKGFHVSFHINWQCVIQ